MLLLFYIPGAGAGAFVTDYLGPKYTLALGVFLQAIFGFIMSGLYDHFTQNVGGFVVMCNSPHSLFVAGTKLMIDGLFLTFGEFGPGDNIGLMAAKTSATCIRGQFYGTAAAVGKIGAFAGAYAFEDVPAPSLLYFFIFQSKGSINFLQIINAFGGPTTSRGNSGPFFVGSGLAALSGIICLLFIPRLDQDCIQDEDIKFRTYLQEQGFDTSGMGIPVEKELVTGGQTERRESDGTAVAGEGEHAREVPVVKAAKKTKGLLERITGVAP